MEILRILFYASSYHNLESSSSNVMPVDLAMNWPEIKLYDTWSENRKAMGKEQESRASFKVLPLIRLCQMIAQSFAD